MDLSRQVALVTGANRGLGAAFVDGLSARGARVYAGARDIADLAHSSARGGASVIPLELDVTNARSVQNAAKKAGDVTVLINNAGVLKQRSLAEAGDLQALREEMEVNVFGLAGMSLAFAPRIAANGGGAIVNILSVASLLPFGPFGTYAASKAAAMSLTHSMRWDYQKTGVRVIGVYAGFIDTGMTKDIDAVMTSPAEIVENTLAGIEAGQDDISADDRSKDVRQMHHGDLQEVLKNVFAGADAFRQNHPVS